MRKRALDVCVFPVFLVQEKQKIKNALVGESRKWGVRSRFSQFNGHLSVWLPGVRTAAPFMFFFSDQHVPLPHHPITFRLVVLSGPKGAGHGSAREEGEAGVCERRTAEFSRIEKDQFFLCNATRRGEKGRGGCRKIQGAESSELCRPSSWLASWSRFGSTPRDNREILSRKRKGEWSWGAYRIGVEGGGWKGRQGGRGGLEREFFALG